jgi:rubredoxin
MFQKYTCSVCGYVYNSANGDPQANISQGTEFKDLSDDWKCPICGAPKVEFKPSD